MKKILFLYFSISLIYCISISFNLKKDKLYNDKCALFFYNNGTFTLILNSESKCLDQCTIYESYSLEVVFDGFCYNRNNLFKLSGENCNGNDDCFSKICENNKCKGKLLNDSCHQNGECDVGLYCNNNTCVNLKDEGENCTNFEEEFLENMNDNCYAGLVCNNEKCVKLGSLSYNDSEENIDNEFSCKSGIIMDKRCIDYINEEILEKSSENQCLIYIKYGNKQKYKIDECEKNLIGEKKVEKRNIVFKNFQIYVNEYNKQLNEKQKNNIHLLNKLSLGNKSLMNKYLDFIIGYSFIDIDNDFKKFFYHNYFSLQ